MNFIKPTIEYGEIWPLLIVFGVACLGVIVEAFLPRERRFVIQTVLAAAGLVAALVGTILIAKNLDVLGDGEARGMIGLEGTLTIDGPTVFFWGIILVFAIGGVLLFAERRLE